MSTGLQVFDTTVQRSNIWLKQVESRLPPCSRQDAYAAVRAVLHVLRDRLPVEAVAGLSAQLPMLLRGVMMEGWDPARPISDVDHVDAFADAVRSALPAAFCRDGLSATLAVLETLAEQIDAREAVKLRKLLPSSLQSLWPSAPGP